MSDDRQIAAGLRAGHAPAWAALYENYFGRVWALAARMIGPDAAAVADVVQEAFLAAARSAGGFDPRRGSLWQWLAGVARNQAVNHLRVRQRDRRVQAGGDLHRAAVEHWLSRLNGDSLAPPGELAAAETAAAVRSALAELPDEHQSILIARYCDEAPVEEIAASQRCSAEAARSRLARARRALREVLTRTAAYSEAANNKDNHGCHGLHGQ